MRYLFFLSILSLIGGTLCVDKGFELLFTSNPREYENLPVKITGKVPSWLNGRLIKNGVGKMEMGERVFHHAFDGFAKLSSFTFNGSNTALFSSKFIESKFYKSSKLQDTIAPYVLFDKPEPPFSAIEKAQQLYHGIDNMNVNVHNFDSTESYHSKKQFIAVSDFWQSYQFDPKTLDTVAYINPDLPSRYALGDHVPLPSTSHPVKEYKSNSYISFVSYMSPLPLFSNYINVIRIKSVYERENIVSIKCKKLSYMHALGVSKNYAVLFADPLYINQWKILKDVQPVNSLDWVPSENTNVYVVNLHTKHVTHLKVPPKVHMHHINSFERDRILIVDYITYPDFSFIKGLTVKTLYNSTARNTIVPGSHIIRYKINLKLKTIVTRTFSKRRQKLFINKLDFPVINKLYQQKQNCYVYGVVLKSDEVNLAKMSLVKNDICSNKDKVWTRDDQYATEPIFVPSPIGKNEDDGVLLTIILNGQKRKSYLAIFDAKSLKVIGKGYLPDVLPFTLHGDFFKI